MLLRVFLFNLVFLFSFRGHVAVAHVRRYDGCQRRIGIKSESTGETSLHVLTTARGQ